MSTKPGEPEAPSEVIGSFYRSVLVIGTGIFATTLAQPEELALPLQRLLKTDLGLTREQVALLLGVAAIPWYLKIAAGFLSDVFPIFGTRRKHYLILSATGAAVVWLLLGIVPRTYWALGAVLFALNAMLVMGSTVTAAVMVQAGQRLQASTGVVSTRLIATGICAMLAGPLGGLLAERPFAIAAATGALIAVVAAPVAAIWLLETPVKDHHRVVDNVYTELGIVLRSRLLWTAAVAFLIIGVPRSFGTSLYYYQVNDLKFTNPDIGSLGVSAGLGYIAASLIYLWIGNHFSLRLLLAMGLICTAIAEALYLFYCSFSAAVLIEGAAGFLTTFGILAIMEVVVCVAPQRAAAMGFAFLISALNLGEQIGNYVAAVLIERFSFTFFEMVAVFSILSILVLGVLPFIPSTLLARKPHEPNG